MTFETGHLLRTILHSEGFFSNYANPRLDALIDQSWVTMDERERMKVYLQTANLIREEVPLCLSFQHVNVYGVAERVNWKGRVDERTLVYEMSFKK